MDHALGPIPSASNLCRAFASLAVLTRRPGLFPIGQVLSLNDDGLDLHPAQWNTTWYKGRRCAGVSVPAYLANTRTEQSYVVTVLAENRSQPIDGAHHPFGGEGSVHAGGPLRPFRTQEPK